MPEYLRLNKTEQRMVEVKTREINKILINNDHPPLQESDVLHWVLEKSLCAVTAEANGEIHIDR